MNVKNLAFLEKEWLTDDACAAFANFKNWSAKKLGHVLRNHENEETPIPDNETWWRDEFDYLLGFYSVVEVATMIGFVEGLPENFQNSHLPVLCNPAVRSYYEWNYRLDLPRRLRERIQSGLGYKMSESPVVTGAFYDFLELTKFIERDPDIESFLWALDGGWREDDDGECDIDIVRAGLGNNKQLGESLQTPPDERNELDRALNGFAKFIQFCEGLDELLSRLTGHIEVAEAMWMGHAYWFRQIDLKLGKELKNAIRGLSKLKVNSGEKQELKDRLSAMEELLEKLSRPPMTEWKKQSTPTDESKMLVSVLDVKEAIKSEKEKLIKSLGGVPIEGNKPITILSVGPSTAAKTGGTFVFETQKSSPPGKTFDQVGQNILKKLAKVHAFSLSMKGMQIAAKYRAKKKQVK